MNNSVVSETSWHIWSLNFLPFQESHESFFWLLISEYRLLDDCSKQICEDCPCEKFVNLHIVSPWPSEYFEDDDGWLLGPAVLIVNRFCNSYGDDGWGLLVLSGYMALTESSYPGA